MGTRRTEIEAAPADPVKLGIGCLDLGVFAPPFKSLVPTYATV